MACESVTKTFETLQYPLACIDLVQGLYGDIRCHDPSDMIIKVDIKILDYCDNEILRYRNFEIFRYWNIEKYKYWNYEILEL